MLHLGPGIFFHGGVFFFWGLFRHNFINTEKWPPGPKNGLERRVSQFYTICGKKSAPEQKYRESYGNFSPQMSENRAQHAPQGSWDVPAADWLELYLETPGRSRPQNELYRRVSTSATICAIN